MNEVKSFKSVLWESEKFPASSGPGEFAQKK